MPSQSILWTTLPNGFVTLPDGKRVPRVSVHIAPRLTPAPNRQRLEDFELFLNWPAFVEKHLRLRLVFNNGGPNGELTLLQGDDPLDNALWRRLFAKDTFVRGHSFTDLKDLPIRSFPATTLHAYLDNLYSQTAAEHGDAFPERNPPSTSPENPLGRLTRDLGELTDPSRRERLDKLFGDRLNKDKVAPANPLSGFKSEAEYAFYQASRFYRRPSATPNPYKERPDPAYTAVPPKVPEFDFHQALAALGDYPRLQRRLGLVLDFAWVNPAPLASTGRVRVDVQWGDPHVLPAWHVKDTPPWTAYRFGSGQRFVARTADDRFDLHHSCLDLSQARDEPVEPKKPAPFLVSQLDLDGGALKAIDAASNLVRLQRPDLTNFRTPDRSDLPALRTGGLAVYRNARAEATQRQLKRAAAAQQVFQALGQPELFAEDLLRGYRVDVWDDVSKTWHTLCAREGRYLFRNGGAFHLDLADEGYVKGASVSRAEAGAPQDLYLHERLAAFDGWSLVASRPGRVLDKDPSASAPAVPAEDVGSQFGFATKFRPAAGSLPRLRFGRRYRLRIRTVDLAGNGLTLKEAGEEQASQPFLYVRYEPVPSPAVLLRARVTEGESLERLVIRSDYDATSADYIVRPDVLDALEGVRDRLGLIGAARAGYVYLAGNERHLAPPKTSQLEAEVHGCFDPFIGPGKDPAPGFHLAKREAATFLSTTMVDLATGAEVPIPAVDLEVVPPTGKTPTDLDAPTRQPGDPLQSGEYVIHKEAQLTVPYLPDPFAAGVVFTGLPGMNPSTPFLVTFAKDWPNPQPFRLRLVERPGTLNGCTQTFADDGKPVWNEASRVLTVFLPKGVEAVVRYSSLLADEGQARQMAFWKALEQRGRLTAALRRLILSGRHWLFTPWRTLTLVHAVQHPLCPPAIEKWTAARQIGDTFCRLRGQWHLSVKSTAKVDVNAAWVEPIDDVAQDTWHTVERSAHVAEVPVESVFSDHHPIPASEAGAPPRSREDLLHEFGDTKHRRVVYRLKGTTRFREYFPIELTRHEAAITRTGPVFSPEADKPGIVVPNSARPAAPRPVSVLPTFLWEETKLAGGGLVRRRRGHGLRVYLERPWWSSGESERLGVVFKKGTVDNRHKGLVTQWGLDPVFASAKPSASPTLAAFPLRRESADGTLSLEELGPTEAGFSVAGHAVEFDPVRKLWFADLEVNAGASYFPFIRLALARFQPYSIPHCHLSRVVQTDFVQLVPTRTLELRPQRNGKLRIQIFGVAPTETFVSRVISEAVAAGAAAKTKSAPASDVVPRSLAADQVRQVFEAGPLAELGEVGLTPGVLQPAPQPVKASKRPGLNEYVVTVEKLPEGASPDFGWQVVQGITLTAPPPPPASKRPISTTVTTRSAAARKTAAPSVTSAAKVRPTKVGALKPAVADALSAGTAAVQIDPLWQADLTLPPATDGRPRRLVVREFELYFKATPEPLEFIPVARRLVYADIVQLPVT